MKRAAVICLLYLMACESDPTAERSGIEPPTATTTATPLRTIGEIEADLASTLFVSQNGQPLVLLSLLGGDQEEGDLGGLDLLLGTYVGSTTGVLRREPVIANAVNMFLWNMVFRRLGEKMATVCTDGTPFLGFATLSSEAFLDIKEICGWPRTDARLALQRLWRRVLSHRAPQSELTIWMDHFGDVASPYSSAPPRVVLKDAVHSMLMSPYFLLEE
jgi:hypothetical protein